MQPVTVSEIGYSEQNKTLMFTSKTQFDATGFMLFPVAVFAVLWFYGFNHYSVLHFHEQMQLFRFDGLYFCSFLGRPGGLAGYLGAFFTQFYYYPVAGSIIIAGVLTAVFLIFCSICRHVGDIKRWFFIPFIPTILLMVSFVNIHFDMSSALGLLFVLAGFRGYIAIPLPARYFAGPVLITALYFIAGGNALLLAAAIFIFEFTDTPDILKEKKRHKGRRKYIYMTALAVWSILLPYAAYTAIYTVPLREAYFALTPWNSPFATIAERALWLSIPALYIIWKLAATKVSRWRLSSGKVAALNSVTVIIITAYGLFSVYDRRAEILHRMAFEVQHHQWKSVMALSKDYPTNNRLVCYFTNIALAESGQMPYRMFHYKQTGAAGLFLDRQLTYNSLWHLSEVYFRLGMIPEALHGAFEALVLSPKEPNAQAVQRLAITNIILRNRAAAEKYLAYFDHSLAYREWAQQQHAYLASAMADSAFHVPNTPISYSCNDFFIDYQQPDHSLLMLLQTNPKHRMAFEYLMSYYMLQKDIDRIKWCMDNFFGNFDYPDIPAHYEEALMVYKNSMQAGDDLNAQYPISRTTRERFDMYVQAFKAAQGSKRNFEQLKKQFGNTYWYYVHFVEPATLQKRDEKNRY